METINLTYPSSIPMPANRFPNPLFIKYGSDIEKKKCRLIALKFGNIFTDYISESENVNKISPYTQPELSSPCPTYIPWLKK